MIQDESYISPYWAGFRSLWWIVAIILFILLLLMWLLGYGPGGNSCHGPVRAVENIAVPHTAVPVAAADYIRPDISLHDASTVHVAAGSSYTDSGAVAVDAVDGDVTVTTSGTVDTNTPGEYLLTYTATDAAGNIATETRTVIVDGAAVADTIAPEIALNSSQEIHITVGQEYRDAGATATDGIDGDITVKTSGSVDTNTPGKYLIIYTATDAAGNTATETRTVIVDETVISDGTAPVISINGNRETHINVGDVYNDAGATANDLTDGNITVQTIGSVDTMTPGEYQITYTATDAAGNMATEVRTIIVEDGQAAIPSAKLYFGFNRSDSPSDNDLTLPPVIDYLHSNSEAKVLVVGFHDPHGSYALNQALATRRAETVSRLIQEQGIDASRIIIESQEDATGSGTPREARRVEVNVIK